MDIKQPSTNSKSDHTKDDFGLISDTGDDCSSSAENGDLDGDWFRDPAEDEDWAATGAATQQ